MYFNLLILNLKIMSYLDKRRSDMTEIDDVLIVKKDADIEMQQQQESPFDEHRRNHLQSVSERYLMNEDATTNDLSDGAVVDQGNPKEINIEHETTTGTLINQSNSQKSLNTPIHEKPSNGIFYYFLSNKSKIIRCWKEDNIFSN